MDKGSRNFNSLFFIINLEIKDCWHIFALLKTDDSVAQLVEHNTFNVGVLGSSPSWITKTEAKRQLGFVNFIQSQIKLRLNERLYKIDIFSGAKNCFCVGK